MRCFQWWPSIGQVKSCSREFTARALMVSVRMKTSSNFMGGLWRRMGGR